ncbi:hypothetical protein D7M10_06925 [Pseudomonas fluorescens]|nr:hypothetical protein D7M10_06925 [Pseudomonas fluorescens]
MKERPILFKGPLVRAILSGQKTVTRRPLKMPHGFWETSATGELVPIPANCPYGKPGDRLWVRETWYCDHFEVMRGPYLKPDDLDIGEAIDDGTLVYAADGLTPYEADQPIWKPSIHMPRWASRILLEIIDVRVERLRQSADLVLLDELGDMLEDCDSTAGKEFSRIEHLQSAGAPLRMIPEMYGFKAWWDKTNGPGSFDANPWVWVVEFKRVTPP